MSHKFGARRFFAATAGAIRGQGRAMLASAPWSLAAFTLSLPFALMSANLFPYAGWPSLALALVNLIALARMTHAWHRVVNLRSAAGGGVSQVRHLALLGALVIAVTAVARITGDLPYVIYMMLGGSNDTLFWGALFASLALIWVPMLYALAVYGLSLPHAAVSGEWGIRNARGAMPYKRWPLQCALLLLVAAAGHAGYTLRMLEYGDGAAAWAQSAASVLLCIPITFVVTTMYAVAYRDSANVPS